MFRRAGIFAAVVAVAALALPATASATWQHHNTQLQQNSLIELTGQFKYQGQVGNIECQVVVPAQLIAGTTTANISAFDVDIQGSETVTDNCQVGGGLANLGCTDVKAVTDEGLPWVAHATSTQTIAITTGIIQTDLHGGIFCPKVLQNTGGTLHLTMSTANTWVAGQLSGELLVHAGGGSQNMTYTGQLSLTPASTYGVA